MSFENHFTPFKVSTEWKTSIGQSFECLVISVLISAYNDMYSSKDYDRSWKETRFSAVLVGHMMRVRDKENLDILIDPEAHLYREEILNGKDDPDEAPRIDIRTRQNWMKESVFYGIEGKILIENNWNSKRASELTGRYIKTGIRNYQSLRYGKHGCIAGYIIEGSPSSIALKINALLDKQKYGNEEHLKLVPFEDFTNHYISEHGNSEKIKIRHLFLNFTN